jgi:hypothetical protein
MKIPLPAAGIAVYAAGIAIYAAGIAVYLAKQVLSASRSARLKGSKGAWPGSEVHHGDREPLTSRGNRKLSFKGT